ncbi:MAG: HEAT repeat domain-containing protein [Elusimicrobia bacterium]|nr:HEAT repeat domain-containing protein [Elusimicrobiota bacterium]
MAGLAALPAIAQKEKDRKEGAPEKDACAKQSEVLGKYRVKEDAALPGLDKKDGKYVERDSEGKDNPCPDTEKLRDAVEGAMKAEVLDNVRRQEMERFKGLGIAGAEKHVEGLELRQLRLLTSVVGANAVTKLHFRDLEELKQLVAHLKAVGQDERNPVGPLNKFFEDTGDRPGLAATALARSLPKDHVLFSYWARAREPFDRGEMIRNAHREGGVQFRVPPSPSVYEALDGVLRGANVYGSKGWADQLKRDSPLEFARLKEQVLAMTEFRDTEIRKNALRFLGQIDRHEHVDLFLGLLEDVSMHAVVSDTIHGILDKLNQPDLGPADTESLAKIKAKLVQEASEAQGQRLSSVLSMLANYKDLSLAPLFLQNIKSDSGQKGLYMLIDQFVDDKGLRKDAASMAKLEPIRKGLLDLLASDDRGVRSEALQMLGRLRDTRLVDTFLKHFPEPTAAGALASTIYALRQEKNDRSSPEAAGKLAKIKEHLTALFKSEDAKTRVMAMRTIFAFKEDVPVQAILELMKDPALSDEAGRLVGDLLEHPDKTAPFFAELKAKIKEKALLLAGHSDPSVAENAISLLGKLRDQSLIRTFIKHLKNDDLAMAAAYAIQGTMRNMVPDPALRAEIRGAVLPLTEPDFARDIRRTAVDILAQLKDPTLLPEFLRLIDDPETRGSAASGLQDLMSGSVPLSVPMKALVLEKFMPMAETHDMELRSIAQRALSDLNDDSLLDFFFKKLNDEGQGVDPILRMVRTYAEQGSGVFIEKVPAILRRLVKETGIPRRSELNWAVVSALGHLNKFDDAQVRAFAQRFSEKGDETTLLEFIGASSASDEVNETSGLHGNVARELYNKAMQLAGNNLSSLLKQDSPEDRSRTARILSRLQRYALLKPDFAKDPALVKMITNAAFSQDRLIPVQQAFAFAEQLRQAGGKAYDDALLARINAKDLTGGFDPGIALLYLGMNVRELGDKQKAEVEAMMTMRFTPELRAHIEERREVPFYNGWAKPIARTKDDKHVWDPKEPLRIAINMTQPGHAKMFLDFLAARGFKQQPKVDMNPAVPADRYEAYKLSFKAAGEQPIELQLNVLPSNNGGWVLNKKLLNDLIVAQWQDSKLHVVGSRAHAGEIDARTLAGIETHDKLYVDGACGGAAPAAMVVGEKCKRCSSFASIGTGEGHLNNPAFERLFRALAQRKDFPAIAAGFRTAGVPLHRFTVDLGRSKSFEEWMVAASYMSSEK